MYITEVKVIHSKSIADSKYLEKQKLRTIIKSYNNKQIAIDNIIDIIKKTNSGDNIAEITSKAEEAKLKLEFKAAGREWLDDGATNVYHKDSITAMKCYKDLIVTGSKDTLIKIWARDPRRKNA